MERMDETILDDVNKTFTTNNYAGFWIRFGAAFIDAVLIGVIQVLVRLALDPYVALAFNIVSGILYYTLMDASSYQGTLGKLAVGIKLVTEEGETLSYGQALGRYLMKIVSAIILLIGYFMMLWSDKKQTLHDKVVGSVVVMR